MSERYYYLRKNGTDGKRGEMFGAVVVTMNDDGTVNRGVSVCSPKDRFNKKIAVNIALGRLRKAIETQSNIPMGTYRGKTEKIINRVYGKLDAGNFHVPANEMEQRMFAPKSDEK